MISCSRVAFRLKQSRQSELWGPCWPRRYRILGSQPVFRACRRTAEVVTMSRASRWEGGTYSTRWDGALNYCVPGTKYTLIYFWGHRCKCPQSMSTRGGYCCRFSFNLLVLMVEMSGMFCQRRLTKALRRVRLCIILLLYDSYIYRSV